MMTKADAELWRFWYMYVHTQSATRHANDPRQDQSECPVGERTIRDYLNNR